MLVFSLFLSPFFLASAALAMEGMNASFHLPSFFGRPLFSSPSLLRLQADSESEKSSSSANRSLVVCHFMRLGPNRAQVLFAGQQMSSDRYTVPYPSVSPSSRSHPLYQPTNISKKHLPLPLSPDPALSSSLSASPPEPRTGTTKLLLVLAG